MFLQRISKWVRLCWLLALMGAAKLAFAAEHHGQVIFGGLPVPGATVTLTQGAKRVATVTDLQGIYFFPDLTDGVASLQVEMLLFATIKQDITIGAAVPASTWELKLLPLDQIRAVVKLVPNTGSFVATLKEDTTKPAAGGKPAEAAPAAEELAQRAADGLLVNGSVNNAAVSPYTLAAAFGNNRTGAKGLYNGGIGVIFNNAVFDARPYSLSGANTPKAAYNRVTGIATFGGPLRIPHFMPRGPNFFIAYQWTRNRNATTQSALVPDLAERIGDLSKETDASGQPLQIFNPITGQPYPSGIVPVNAQAQALLNLYPLPNLEGNARYNYQVPLVSNTHQDALQSRLNKTFSIKNQVFGDFGFETSRSDSPNIFRFLDKTNVLGLNTGVTWSHRFNRRTSVNLGYRFSRLSTRVTPYWQNRQNVSGAAGITGNNQDAMNWGPPGLVFSGGIAALSDAQSSFTRNRTDAFSYSMLWNHNRHNVTYGADFRRQQFNYLSQQDPRGTFTFTGAATQRTVNGTATGGSDFADFLAGVPDTSSIATGNADKYLRQSVYDAYVADDWRVTPQFTLNTGARWEYGAPITELHDRLVNLDVASGFTAVTPVLASDPIGTLTGQHYPTSLLRPDRSKFQPRLGLSWRPIPNSSMVVRGGYGIYADTSVYQATALQLAQQAPLSKSLSVQNSPACPLTLANAFNACPASTANTFAADPNFRTGYAQNWQLSVQHDLPASLQLTATYLGIKGTRGVQEFLPNTYPIGASNPCPSCPSGFAYLTSNGNSTRESGKVLLRRRLHNGFTASLQYTFSKSIDNDAALGGQGPVASGGSSSGQGAGSLTNSNANQGPLAKAQNWRDLNAERGLSTFDQRHLVTVQLQYTTGMGIGGRTLMSGWRGDLLKEWTVLSTVTAGTGLPETPVYLAAVPGTGFTGSIRPNRTSAPLYVAPAGYFLNSAAYSAPTSGQWGSAGRGSITGPGQFTWNASLARTFRLKDGYNLNVQADATNIFNHVNFTSWNTTTNSTQFGLPLSTNAMRSIQTTVRLRF